MRRGSLRWDEQMLADHASRSARWGAATEWAKADAVSSRESVGEHTEGAGFDSPTDAASSPPLYPLVTLCRAAGLPEPIPEYKFHPLRKWRADYCWPIHKIIVEIEGGAWSQGRHTRGAGFVADMAKYNAATLLGFAVLRYTPRQLGDAVRDLRIMLAR